MKKTFILLFALLPIWAMAQVTPEAVIANAPALPTPAAWGAKGEHSDAFKAKIDSLNKVLGKMMNASVANITEQDVQQVQAQQMKEIEEAPKRMEQAAKGLEVLGAMMQKLNLSEADMKKMADMSDEVSEAFIMKRMQEKGVKPEDFAAMVSGAGLDTQPPANTPKVNPKDIEASQKADMAYMEQLQLYEKKSAEWEADAKKRIKIEEEKYQKSLPENIYGLDDVVTGGITKEQYDSQQRHLQALLSDCLTAEYRIWTEVIHNCQGELKKLMQYASAADQAKAKVPGMTGNAAFDKMQQSSNYAVSVAALYLDITESEPKW